MIIGSIVLIVVAAGLWVAGLRQGSESLFYGSLVTSVLAALALVAGVRLLARTRVPEDDFDVGPAAGTRPVATPIGRASVPPQGSRRSSRRGGPVGRVSMPPDDAPDLPGGEPPDEPPVEPLAPAEADRVTRLSAHVAVVDGRPRYHLTDCLHLLGRDAERLPVAEAVELGFTPCVRCAPVRALLATAAQP